MFKAKHWGIAAMMMLVAFGAMASNFRVADQVYLPAAGHVAGFISDVFISNLSSDSVDVTFIYGPQSIASAPYQTGFSKITLLPNERRELLDFFANTLGIQSGFGQVIFNACKAGADCTPALDTGENPNFRLISVESRIYFAPANCLDKYNTTVCGAAGTNAVTTGQLFAGTPWYSFVSSTNTSGLNTVFITGFRQNAAFRGNLGLVNASQFSSTTLTAKLRNGATGAQIGTDFNQTLGPLNMLQINLTNAFPAISAQTTNVYVEVSQGVSTPVVSSDPAKDAVANGCDNGCPAFLAYGSVLDNFSSDATTLEPQFTKALNTTQIACVYTPDQLTVPCTLKVGGKTVRRAARH